MPASRVKDLPAPPGAFPWANKVASDSLAAGSLGHTHTELASNYTGDHRFLPAVTGLVGGGGTNLDGVVTASSAVAAGAVRVLTVNREVMTYRLEAGNDEEQTPDVVRPDDYHASTNAVVWRLLGASVRSRVGDQPAQVTPSGGNRIYAKLTGYAIGTEDFTGWVRFRVPSVEWSGIVMRLGSNYAGSGANNFTIKLVSDTGNLAVEKADGSGVTQTVATLTGLQAVYANQVIDLVVTRDSVADKWRVYVNGVLQVETASYATETVDTTYAVGASAFRDRFYRMVLFNRTLAAAEVVNLGLYGIDISDMWAAPTANYATDFSAGVDGYSVLGADVGVGNQDGVGSPTTDNVYKFTAAIGYAGPHTSTKFSALTNTRRRYRVTGSLWIPDTNTTLVKASLTANPTVIYAASANWSAVRTEFVAADTSATINWLNNAESSTWTGDEFAYVGSLSFQRIGAFLDLDFTVGIGGFFPDRSDNRLHGESVAGIVHLHTQPTRYGTMTLIRELEHGDISATAATTKLFELPPNCGILRLQLDRTAAFDAAITLDLGITGTPAKFVSAAALDGTGILGVDCLDKDSEHTSASTAIYLQKSGATTVGTVKVRCVYEIRG